MSTILLLTFGIVSIVIGASVMCDDRLPKRARWSGGFWFAAGGAAVAIGLVLA